MIFSLLIVLLSLIFAYSVLAQEESICEYYMYVNHVATVDNHKITLKEISEEAVFIDVDGVVESITYSRGGR